MTDTSHRSRTDINLALVCQSNLNRSMEAHDILLKNGFAPSALYSYGAGSKVRLPGESYDKPNVYDFGTPYEFMYKDLTQKNKHRYTKNGMLNMVSRDMKVKAFPERWQEEKKYKEIVIAYDKRVYDIIVADVEKRSNVSDQFRPCHIICLDTTDSHAEAKNAAARTLDLVDQIFLSEDWEDEMTSILDGFEAKYRLPTLHTVQYY